MIRPDTKIILVCAAVAFAAACSNQQLYTAVQQHERQECGKLPQVQYEQCMKDIAGTYEDYAREREDLKRETSGREPEP